MGGEWSKMEVLQGTNLLVLDGQRIYLPEGCRAEVIKVMHTSHAKAPMMGATIREMYFWPHQRKELQEHAENCDICQDFRRAKARAQGVEHSENIKNLKPMDQVSTDLFEIPGSKDHWIVFGDRASGFVQGEKLTGTKTQDIVGALDKYINRYAGPPYVLISDGGPQYMQTNKILEEYCQEAGIIHRTSSALNPTSNGFAEAAVCTLKAQVRKVTKGK